MDKHLYFSIVSHHQTDFIIKNFTDFPREVKGYILVPVIVDNTGSERLKAFCDKESLRYYCDGIRRGFGSNHNRIFQWLNPQDEDRFVVCNPDIHISKEQLEKIVLNAFAHDIYSPLVYFDKEKNLLDNPDKEFPGLMNFIISFTTQKRLHYGTRMRTIHPGWISGAFMVFKASVFRLLGGFDEDYFMYCEDMDICYRAREKGYDIFIDHDCYIEHFAQMHSRNILSRNNLWHIKSAFKFALKNQKIYQLNNIKAKRKTNDGRREGDNFTLK